MTLRKYLFAICLSTPAFCTSQVGYPKRLVIDRDTVVAVTPSQLVEINLDHVRLLECQQERGAYLQAVRSFQYSTAVSDSIIEGYRAAIAACDQSKAASVQLIDLKAGEVKRQHRRGNIFLAIAGVLAALLITRR